MSVKSELLPNEGKNLLIETDFGKFLRYPVKTHVVKDGDSLKSLIDEHVKAYLEEGDSIFISEKIVAISQGRAFKLEDIKVTPLARFLSRFVQKTSYGIGLGMPETMQLAIDEIGRPKILFAAFCSALTKPFGKRGVFYNIVGTKGRAIDGPCDYTLPPYNNYAKLAPKDPDKVAAELKAYTGHTVVIIDANDIGCNVLGFSDDSFTEEECAKIFKDNPLGQGSQQTPIALVRRA
ncbi:MAG: F420-0--gamma-glutamyl ligase [Clostridiales bacterium]|nr:F420-0--gamma-glutamyl ligase [Clostridiales bacterium]